MNATARQVISSNNSGENWLEFVTSIESIIQQHAGDREELQYQLNQLVKENVASLRVEPGLQQALAGCPAKHELSAPSWWTTLYENNCCHIALVAVYEGMAMPLHDHPGSQGISVVLSGRAQIHTATCLELDQATGLAEIMITDSKECEEQDVCWIDKQHNLHSIEAKTDIALALVVHTPKVDRDRQAFYFPVEDKTWIPGQRTGCKRIRLRHNPGH
jgi:hypothetical protein